MDSQGDFVEIKSFKTDELTDSGAILQTAVNGSRHILGCKLDDCREHLLSTAWISTEEMRANNEKSFINRGNHRG